MIVFFDDISISATIGMIGYIWFLKVRLVWVFNILENLLNPILILNFLDDVLRVIIDFRVWIFTHL